MPHPVDALPDDVATLKAMLAQRHQELADRDQELAQRRAEEERHRAQLAQQRAQIEEQHSTIAELQRLQGSLEHRLHLALQRLHGRLSERIDPRQLRLFGLAMEEAAKAAEAIAAEEPSTAPRKKKPGHGRRPLPADLPRHRVEHEIDPAEAACPCCGGERVRIGEDVSEQLDYVPSSLYVIQHVRPKYACRACEDGGVVRAEKPDAEPIARGLPGPGLVAHVITSKYADHAPLYRLEGMLARHGVEIARSTMCGWAKAAADLLAPLVKVMADEVRASSVIHTDDTPVPVQAPGRGRTKTGRLWVYLGDRRHPYTVFDYTPSRSRDGPAKWLAGYRGFLQADAFGGYDGIYASGEVVEVACWAHARRKFHEARKSDPARSHKALAMIRLLYAVERDAAGESGGDPGGVAPAERLMLRRQRSLPVLADLRRWLLEQREMALPKSPMGVAIGYALSNWDALTRYAGGDVGGDGSADAREGRVVGGGGVGELSIDNNAAERAIRPLTVGRKNYLFFGSDTGGQTAATLYSVIASAKRHGLDPFIYLRELLATIAATPRSELPALLPDRWRDRQIEELNRA